MNYCPHCGEKVNTDQDICLNCGKYLKQSKPTKINDNNQVIYGLLGFFLPIAGIIIYALTKNETPKSASSALKGAITSIVLFAVFYIYIYLIF